MQRGSCDLFLRLSLNRLCSILEYVFRSARISTNDELSCCAAGRSPGIRYTALFFCLPGTYLGAPTAITWMANNVSPHLRRATVIAFACVLTNSGGILSTWLLGTLSKPPLYQLGTKVLLALGWTMFVANAANWLYLWQENKRKAKIRATMSQADEKPGLGDRSAWFIYAL